MPTVEQPANDSAIEITISEITTEPEELAVMAKIVVKNGIPAQDDKLPDRLEAQTIAVGQALMREYYRLIMERADRELILSVRDGAAGEGIRRMGTRRYTIKTRFGTVVIKRIRIQHKADGITEIASHRVWRTPKQRLITAGLKSAVCQQVVKKSFSSTVRQLENDSGEVKLLSKSTVGNILHAAGEGLAKAAQQRAATIYQTNDRAKELLGRADAHLGEDYFEAVWLKGKEITEEELPELLDEIEWDARELRQTDREASKPASSAPSSATNNNNVTTSRELIIVEPDEVVVRSQEEGREWLINYSAVVSTVKACHYFTAQTSTQLWYQVAGLLAQLQEAANESRLLLLSDGARWIRYWFEGLGIANKESVMCAYHMQQRCWRLIREASKNRADRLIIYRALMKYLWRGEVADAREYLKELITLVEDGISEIVIENVASLEKIREYLLNRAAHMPNYLARLRGGERIANTKVEKFNDWSVSVRCKKQNGMRWSSAGVSAIAALEAARRNGELKVWREQGKLPTWQRAA